MDIDDQLTLPPEVLAIVFSCLCHAFERVSSVYSTLGSASQVCRQWHASVTPLLYQSLDVYFGAVRDPYWPDRGSKATSSIKLLMTLRQQPILRTHVRYLRMNFVEQGEDHEHELLQIIKPFATHLRLAGTLATRSAEKLLPEIATMKAEEMDLCQGCAQVIVPYLIRYQEHGVMQKLSFRGNTYSPAGFGGDNPAAHHRSADVQHLDCDVSYWPIQEVQILFMWPRSLRFLKLETTFPWQPMGNFPGIKCATDIQKLLDFHMGSLECIELSEYLKPDHSKMVDFSAFGMLRQLSMNNGNLFSITPQEACVKLSAPLLERLDVDMRWSGYVDSGVHDLTEENCEWFVTFFRLRSLLVKDNRLRHLHLGYYWNDAKVPSDVITGYIHSRPWPNTHLEIAALQFDAYNVELTWPEPHWSREVWENMIHTQTVPGWEDRDTEEERMMRQPATEEQLQALRSALRAHSPSMIALDGGRWQKRVCEHLTATCRRHFSR